MLAERNAARPRTGPEPPERPGRGARPPPVRRGDTDDGLAPAARRAHHVLERATGERERLAVELGGVRAEVATARGERDASRTQAAGLEADLAAVRTRRDTLEQQLAERDQALEASRTATAAQQAQTAQAEEQVALINRQLSALREQLQAVAAALELSPERRSSTGTPGSPISASS